MSNTNDLVTILNPTACAPSNTVARAATGAAILLLREWRRAKGDAPWLDDLARHLEHLGSIQAERVFPVRVPEVCVLQTGRTDHVRVSVSSALIKLTRLALQAHGPSAYWAPCLSALNNATQALDPRRFN